ncbi:MAG TPA: M20 family metallopeptidase [Candidatus Limnocylindrales bacterium]|nr:M20 family metallopeptidase [Candidatus Limnocylindrales bacterium]
MDRRRKILLSKAEALRPDAVRMLGAISGYAELGLKEFRTSRTLAGFLEERGFRVERGIAGMETAFRAEYVFGKGKPAVAFLCEMDALPGLGHACGHNVVGVSSACAAAALAAFGADRFRSGRIVTLGTPAEEMGYGKARMAEQGVFRGIDAAMMVHPSSRRHVAKGYLALHKIRFTYLGKASHAAAYPEHGINALDGVLLLFQGTAALRQHLPETVRVHGIVTEGGRAPNIIPERAQAYFYVRGENDAELADAVRRVKECARGAAKATGCRLRMEEGPYTLSEMKVNPVLADGYRRAIALLGLPESGAPADKNRGSSDIGNVSQVVPTIQPNVPISGGEKAEIHTRSFEEASRSPSGVEGMMEGIRALALTGYELFSDPGCCRRAWAAFRTSKQGRS